jgi:microcystin-dependent protein
MTKISVLPASSFPTGSDYIPVVVGGVTSKVTVTDLSTILKTILLPSGLVQQTASSSAPSGWLLCDGSAISRTTYSSLYTAIGTTYGTGDGTTTFNIPDLRGRVIAGKDDMGGTAANRLTNFSSAFGNISVAGATLGAVGGNEKHTHLQTFGSDSGGAYAEVDGAGSGHTTVITVNRVTIGATAGSVNGSRQDGVYDSPTTQPTMILNAIIKT